MRIRVLQIFILFSLVAVACSDGNRQEETATEQPASAPALPEQRIAQMRANVDLIDFIFYKLPMSMTQNDQPSIQQTLSFIGDPVPAGSIGCASIARVGFMSNGEIIEEAEMHLSDDCAAFVFLENGKPAYAHSMSQNGVAFFGSMVNNAMNQRNQMVQ